MRSFLPFGGGLPLIEVGGRGQRQQRFTTGRISDAENKQVSHHAVDDLNSAGSVFYRRAMEILNQGQVPFLVGGAYALECHTGIVRRTKDFDIFVQAADVQRVLDLLSLAGYTTDLTFPHWIAKAFAADDYLDIIFNSGNGVCPVDELWFQHACEGTVLGVPVNLCPAEETIWQKAYILERDRCDVADVAHLLRATGARLDWRRLLERFGPYWEVLYAQLILFGFIYPGERPAAPAWVWQELGRRLAEKGPTGGHASVCQGTLLSATQYLRDVDAEGLRDARLKPDGNITREQLAIWTANFTAK